VLTVECPILKMPDVILGYSNQVDFYLSNFLILTVNIYFFYICFKKIIGMEFKITDQLNFKIKKKNRKLVPFLCFHRM
jgi:hypothetical protein